MVVVNLLVYFSLLETVLRVSDSQTWIKVEWGPWLKLGNGSLSI